MLSVDGSSQTATILQVVQKLVQLDEAQTRLKETLKARESEISEQKKEMRKLTDLVNKMLKEVENQTNTIKGKLIARINDPGPHWKTQFSF